MKDQTIFDNNNEQLRASNSEGKSALHVKHGESLDAQRQLAVDYKDKPLKYGDKWYLISSDWFVRWLKYIGLESSGKLTPSSNLNPGVINNQNLFAKKVDRMLLKTGLCEEVDYYTVPEELWFYLVKVYTISQKEDEIERLVINDSIDEFSESLKIEVYRPELKMSCSNWTNQSVQTRELSRQSNIENLVEQMKLMFKIPTSKSVRLYLKTDERNIQLVKIEPDATLSTVGFGVDDTLLLDVQDENGQWSINSDTLKKPITSPPPPPPPPYSATFNNNTTSSSSITNSIQPITTRHPITTRSFDNHTSSYSNRGNDYKPGLCGLSNLGNTCFMNSAIQCMSNVPLLTDYFRDNRYKKEINTVNPLGRRGEIAEAYADLINEMWSGNNSYTIPRNFKLNLSRFAPQFTGFQQQDSHELLAFLLDGLHEDLNRIIKKPYVELGSHVGKTDEQFAEESWQDHKKRNDSIIVDIFHGLLKSTLNCLTCNEISIKFDPFCYLSVPLPSKKERQIEVFFVPLESNQPITKYKLSVFKNGTINDLCASLEVLLPSVPKSHMVVCDVYTNKFFKVYESNEPISTIRDRDDIYIYQLISNYSNTDFLKVKLHLREKSSYMYNSSFFGLPLIYMVPKANLNNSSLYQIAFQYLKRFLKDANSISNDEINSKLNNSLNVNDEDELTRSQRQNDEADQSNDNEADSENNSQSAHATNNEEDGESSSSSTSSNVRSSQRLKNKSIQQSRVFNLLLCKNDNIDYDNSHINLPMDENASFEWPSGFMTGTSASVSSNLSVVSLIADFGSNSNKKYYNKKAIEEYNEHPSCSSTLIKKKDVISLSDCFNLYTKTEELSEQDYWYCAKCKTHQPSTKKFDLWSLPPVLVVHLKRFSYSRLYRDKIDTLVEFPLTDLDMSQYLINTNAKKSAPTTKYDLIAVSNHYGSLGGGHYTAYGKNRYDNKWYYFDDSSVSGSDETSVCTNAAYLLVYLRQDMHHIFDSTKKETSGMAAAGSSSLSSSASSSAEKMDY